MDTNTLLKFVQSMEPNSSWYGTTIEDKFRIFYTNIDGLSLNNGEETVKTFLKIQKFGHHRLQHKYLNNYVLSIYSHNQIGIVADVLEVAYTLQVEY